jgi:type I restriction enzyme S subunit
MSLNLDKSRWTRVKFGEVVFNVNSTVKDAEAAGLDRVIAMEHLDPGELRIQRWGNVEDGTTFTRRVKPGQTLFGKRRAYQRKVAYAEFDAICSGDILTFQANETHLLPEFLPFLVQSDGFFAHALGTSAGSLSPRTNWTDLSDFEFELPPLDAQRRLAELLWKFEDHLNTLRDAISAIHQATEEKFSAMLNRYSHQGEIVSDLLDYMTVGVVVKPTQYYTEESTGVPALRGLNILRGSFDLRELVRFKVESAAALTKSTLQAGDVVIVRTGRAGDAAVVTEEIAGFNCIDLIITRPSNLIYPQFFARYLNSSYGRDQIARLSAGTAQQHFNVGALKKLRFPDIGKADQIEIDAKLTEMDNAAHMIALEIDHLNRLRANLLTDIFGGAQ